MSVISDRSRLDPVISSIYEAALAPEGWQDLLADIAGLFRAGFADIFARTDDRQQYHGLAHGLDRADYEDEFLGEWFTRNVWGLASPPKATGEIAQTREMVAHEDLRRSDIFNLYLDRRELHEGLRLAIWVGGGWVQDLSLLRPFSIGPYDDREIAMAEILLPHLQRAAAVARRLGEARVLVDAGLIALEHSGKAMLLLDAEGHVLQQNGVAETLVAQGDFVTMRGGLLRAVVPQAGPSLQAALARAGGTAPDRAAQSVSLPRRAGAGRLEMTAVPLRVSSDWSMRRPPATMVFFTETEPPAPRTGTPGAPRLMRQFGLTAAEAELALDLLGGDGLAEVAARRGRSVNTVRTHLRHVMGKTQVHRQSELVRLLLSLPAEG